jgi:hypothetical protein
MSLAAHREQCESARSWQIAGKILAVIVGSSGIITGFDLVRLAVDLPGVPQRGESLGWP